MHHRLLILLGLFLMAWMGSAQAQIESAVSWKSYLEAGDSGSAELVFEARIAPGFHIYSAQAPEGMPALSTSLALDEEMRGVALIGEFQEEGDKEVYYDDIFEAELGIFHNRATFRQKVMITDPSESISGELLYQTCDDMQCIPGSLPFRFTLSD